MLFCRRLQFPQRVNKTFKSQYFKTRFLSTKGLLDADTHDDDEFIFPVQLAFPHAPHQWLWSGADISRIIDLSTDCFNPEKKILHTTDTVKVLNVNHKEHGDILFTLIQDKSKMWKICNIAVFGDTSRDTFSPFAMSSHKMNAALGSMLDVLNDKEQTLWKATPELDVFSHPYQYICPPFSIIIADSINNLIKLSEGDRASYLPSCFKISVIDSVTGDDVHFKKISDNDFVNVNKKIVKQSENLALVSLDIFAYDRVGMLDVIYEMLLLLEQTSPNQGTLNHNKEENVLGFTSEGHANSLSPPDDGAANDVTGGDGLSTRKVSIASLIVGNERRKEQLSSLSNKPL